MNRYVLTFVSYILIKEHFQSVFLTFITHVFMENKLWLFTIEQNHDTNLFITSEIRSYQVSTWLGEDGMP